jgi:hypothetical protein
MGCPTSKSSSSESGSCLALVPTPIARSHAARNLREPAPPHLPCWERAGAYPRIERSTYSPIHRMPTGSPGIGANPDGAGLRKYSASFSVARVSRRAFSAS